MGRPGDRLGDGVTSTVGVVDIDGNDRNRISAALVTRRPVRPVRPVRPMPVTAARSVSPVKVLATGLATGILLDAVVVRALLVPAMVGVLGRWNWWLPRWAALPLRVAPSPVAADPVTPDRAERLLRR